MSPNQINQENYSCILLLFTFHISVCVFSELLGQVWAVLMSQRMGTQAVKYSSKVRWIVEYDVSVFTYYTQLRVPTIYRLVQKPTKDNPESSNLSQTLYPHQLTGHEINLAALQRGFILLLTFFLDGHHCLSRTIALE